ncbi:heterokaryon incompatibility protein-domain-containing protein [Biscogniauxia marginata]|nr:heterokaryon incompatibility protein-domain-containing protein [Biscogniauxia marginata]
MWCSNYFEFKRLWKRTANRHDGRSHARDARVPFSKLEKFSYFTISLDIQSHHLTSFHDECDSKEASNHQYRLVRLLRLIPSEQEGIIACEIRVVDINSRRKPEYDALSYTWGPTTREEADKGMSSERKYPIICNGGQLLITENLFNCLRQLDADPNYNRDLWIDAICVNQEDHDERCQQVSIMDDIYRSAGRVIIWLGVADKYTQPACELISKFSRLSEKDRLTVVPSAFENEPNSDLLGRSNSLEHWCSVALLFGRTWFTRAWVIQEIVLAQSTIVLCGRHTLDWNDMETMSHFLATRTSANIFKTHLFKDHDAKPISYKNPTKLKAIKDDKAGDSGDVLLRCLIRCRTYDASNDHDKVYSLLGLVHKDQELPKILYPDYHRSVPQLYTDVTKYILKNAKDLHVLAHAEGDDFKQPKYISALPSWVPDWSVRAELGLRITNYKRYQAAGDLPCFKEVQPGGCLILRGAQLDVVSQIGDTKAEVNSSKVCTNWLGILKQLELEYPGRDHHDAFWRTLVVDTDSEGKVPVKNPWGNAFHVWMGLKDNPPPEERKSATEYETAFMHSLNLRLFRTSRGHLGLGTKSCRKGDLVWIVPGSRVPLILRNVDGKGPLRYRLVGGTYLHGFMQGESLSELEFGTITLI